MEFLFQFVTDLICKSDDSTATYPILKNGYSSLISHEILVSVSDASEEVIVTDF